MQGFLSGSWRSIASAQAYVGGAWKTLTTGKAYISGAWRDTVTFVQQLTLSASNFTGRSSTSSVSAVCPAVPAGGLSPYTYSWIVLSGSGGTISLANTTSANVTVYADSVAVGTPATCTVQCTVTDSLGKTATATANGTLINRGSIGGGGGTF